MISIAINIVALRSTKSFYKRIGHKIDRPDKA